MSSNRERTRHVKSVARNGRFPDVQTETELVQKLVHGHGAVTSGVVGGSVRQIDGNSHGLGYIMGVMLRNGLHFET